MTRVIFILGNVVFALVALAIGGVILALTVLPPVLHYQTYVVLSGSMEPAIHTGSVIVATAAQPEALKVGDIITFIRPGDQENLTHRIVDIKQNAQGPSFVTKGDANGAPDQDAVRYDHLAGKVQVSVPWVGYAFKFIGSPTMRFLMIVVPGILLLGSWLWEVWRPERKLKDPDVQLSSSMSPVASKPLAAAAQNLELGMPADAAAVPLRQ